LSIVADVERPGPESGLTLLWLSMAGVAVVVLIVCAAALLATIALVYRHVVATPIVWLLTRLAGLAWAWRG
jgi:hypothetical protein